MSGSWQDITDASMLLPPGRVGQAKERYAQASLYLLLPYHPAERPLPLPTGFDGTLYPEGMESVPKRLAISRANRWMVGHSDYLIAWAWRPGNARSVLDAGEKRARQGLLHIIRLPKGRGSPQWNGNGHWAPRQASFFWQGDCWPWAGWRSAKRRQNSWKGPWEKPGTGRARRRPSTPNSPMGQGHKITQYIIRTTFYGQERGQEGAKLAMEQIVGPDAAEDSRACQVNGCQAMVYHIKEKGYLCWTLSPEYSIVLEYDWAGASDAEILQMGESIQLGAKAPGREPILIKEKRPLERSRDLFCIMGSVDQFRDHAGQQRAGKHDVFARGLGKDLFHFQGVADAIQHHQVAIQPGYLLGRLPDALQPFVGGGGHRRGLGHRFPPLVLALPQLQGGRA